MICMMACFGYVNGIRKSIKPGTRVISVKHLGKKYGLKIKSEVGWLWVLVDKETYLKNFRMISK